MQNAEEFPGDSSQLFSVGFGSSKRAEVIRGLLNSDPTNALIFAAISFEWTVKRTILILGSSPTVSLREELSKTFKMQSKQRSEKTLAAVWHREVVVRDKHIPLGKVVTKIVAIQNIAAKARGKVIHGNGTLSREVARESTELYLSATDQLTSFVSKRGFDIDQRLSPRRAKDTSSAPRR